MNLPVCSGTMFVHYCDGRCDELVYSQVKSANIVSLGRQIFNKSNSVKCVDIPSLNIKFL